MSGGNQVKLTFTGDTASADKAFKDVEKGADDAGKSVKTAGGHFKEASGGIGSLNEKVEGSVKQFRGSKDVVDGLSGAVGAFGATLPGPIGGVLQFAGGMADLADGLSTVVGPALEKLAAKFGIMTGATEAQAAATGEAAVAQDGLNASLLANPIGLIIAALVALGVGLYEAYKHVKVFRDAVNEVATVLKTVVLGAFHAVESAVTAVIDFVKDHWKLILGILLGPFGLLAAAIATHFGEVKKVITEGISAIKGFFSDAGSWLLDAGKYVLEGLKNGIENGLGALKDTVLGVGKKVIGWAKDALSIFSPSKAFRQIGGYIIDGLVLGITDNSPKAAAAMKALSDTVKKYFTDLGSRVAQAKSIGASIAAAFSPHLDDPSSGTSVLDGLKDQLAKTQALQRDLVLLSKNGLNKDLLGQLAAGGIASLPAAEQLAIGGKGAIGAANSYTSGLSSAGNSIGALIAQKDTGVQLTANLTTVLKVDGKTLAEIVQKELLQKKRTSGALGLS